MRVCLFCGSKPGSSPVYAQVARELGRSCAERGLGLVYGGGRVGLMGLAADAALAAGGEVIGVITEQLVESEEAHQGLTRLEVVGSLQERKARMGALAGGFVILPGGFGTLDECSEMLTWNQMGLLAGPVVLLDVDGFWSGLLAWADRALQAGFLSEEHRGLAQQASSVSEALDLASAPPALAPGRQQPAGSSARPRP